MVLIRKSWFLDTSILPFSKKVTCIPHSRFGQKSSLFKYQKNYTSKSKASFQYLWVRTAHEKILRVCFRREFFLFEIEGYPFGFPKIFQIQRGDPSMSNKKFSLGKHTLKIFSWAVLTHRYWKLALLLLAQFFWYLNRDDFCLNLLWQPSTWILDGLY